MYRFIINKDLRAYMKYFSIILLTLGIALNAEWIDLGSSYPESYQRKLLSSDSDNIRLEFTMSGYYQTLVETPKGNAYIIDAGNGASILQEGVPDLDKITAPILISNEGHMNYQIISSEYVDIEDINVAPSKGNLTRDINPNTVPFAYSEVYDRDTFYPNEII